MQYIYKYNVSETGDTTQLSGQIVQLLTVQNQYNKAVVWALIDDEAEHVHYQIKGHPTGWSLDTIYSEWTYLNTVQFDQGTYVMHYFYKKI